MNLLKSGPRAGLLMVLTASMLWGTGNVVAKSVYAVAQTNPYSLAFFRMALSVPALIVICLFVLGRRAFAVQTRDLPAPLVAGLLVALYQVSFYASLTLINVGIATVLALASAPVLVALLSTVFLRERLSRIEVLALVCSIAGIVLITDVNNGSGASNTVAGVGLALLAGLLYAITVMIGRRMGGNTGIHPLQTTTISFSFGALFLFVIALLNGLVVTYPLEGWLRLAYLGVLPTAVGYALFFAGMRSTRASTASIATLAEPLTSALLATLLFAEPLGLRAIAGCVLMIAAMVILARQNTRQG
jgi:drug/metabolite transporter, DME family